MAVERFENDFQQDLKEGEKTGVLIFRVSPRWFDGFGFPSVHQRTPGVTVPKGSDVEIILRDEVVRNQILSENRTPEARHGRGNIFYTD